MLWICTSQWVFVKDSFVCKALGLEPRVSNVLAPFLPKDQVPGALVATYLLDVCVLLMIMVVLGFLSVH